MPNSLPNIKVENNIKYIFCIIRKKWIILTPEEKVRQFTLHYLIHRLNYPQKYISVEKTLKVNELIKRYDIVVFNQELQPKILIECKAETVELKEKTMQQIAIYNITLQVPFLMITNGSISFYFKIQDKNAVQIQELPTYDYL